MSRYRHRCITEHIWRALRALLIIIGTMVWLYLPGFEGLVLALVVLAMLVDQFKGYIENRIEDLLHWERDFRDGE